MNLKNIIISTTLVLVLSSCNQDKVYEDEQYKNVFALICNDENVYEYFFDLKNDESTGYVSLSMGGSNNISENITINLVEDRSYIDTYNKINFDMDVSKYAKPLSQAKYDIESYECTIPAGEVKTSVPIKIRPNGLSPDSTYFIAIRVDSYNRYEVNPEKNYLLFSVKIKNYWSKNNGTSYTLRGFRKQEGSSEVMVPGVKVMHPLTKNKVRIMAGTEIFEADRMVFNKSAITLEVSDNNKVTIAPYKDIKIEQINGDKDFPNTFKIEDDGFKTYKTFLLRYNYTIDGATYEMKEELRLEFDPKADDELS